MTRTQLIALIGIVLALLLALLLSGCVHKPTHNARGGYIDACGDLPGMVGDDC